MVVRVAQEVKALMTADEFLRLPDDGVRRELVYGEVIEMTPGGTKHSMVGLRVAARLATAMGDGAGLVVGADCGFVLSQDPDVVRAPDAAYVSAARVPDGGVPDGFFPGAPDLAVEVASPSDNAVELQAKVMEYLEAGVTLVWVVYPKTRQVVLYRAGGEVQLFGEGDTLTGGSLLPDLSIPVTEIFAE